MPITTRKKHKTNKEGSPSLAQESSVGAPGATTNQMWLTLLPTQESSVGAPATPAPTATLRWQGGGPTGHGFNTGAPVATITPTWLTLLPPKCHLLVQQQRQSPLWKHSSAMALSEC
jgi:hypothetical protein